MARLFFILSTIVASVLAGSVRLAPLVEPQNGKIIPGEYIVSLREPSGPVALGSSRAMVNEHLNSLFDANSIPDNKIILDNKIIHKYDVGYAARLNQKTLDRLRLMPDVDYVEANQVVFATGFQKFPRSWGLDRIDQRDLPLSYSYSYDQIAGAGVSVCSYEAACVSFTHSYNYDNNNRCTLWTRVSISTTLTLVVVPSGV